MDFPPEPSKVTLESAEEDVTSYSKMFTAFKQKKYWQKYLVLHLTFSDKLDVLYSGFTLGEVRSGSGSSYQAELALNSSAWGKNAIV